MRDLKDGWRPGIEVDNDLIPRKGAEAIRDAQEVMPLSESDDDHGAIVAGAITFYYVPGATMSESGARSKSGMRLVAHAPGIEDPERPACKRLMDEQ